MLQHFQQETDVNCRQASRAHTLCVCEATLLEVVQNEVWHRPAEITTEVTLMVASVSPNLHHPPLHQWYLHTDEAIHAMDTDAAPYHHRRWL